MTLSRRLRLCAASLALASLVFSQLAVAAYACPGPQAMAMAAIALEEGRDAPCCGDGVPVPQPVLCAAHCQQGDQLLDKPAAPTLPAIAWVAILPALAAPDVAPAAAPSGEQRSLLARATAPSLAVRHCCFRV